MEEESDPVTQVTDLLGLGEPAGGSAAPESIARALQSRTRSELLAFAKRLGVKAAVKLSKDGLVSRLQDVLQSAPPEPPTAAGRLLPDQGTGPVGSAETAFPAKFDLGMTEKGPTQHIPWGYGQDRITALPVDPEKMFAYWEVTEQAIENARRGLGPAGREAWLNLRVYDVTGRLFDGTNAHSYFDHKLERHDRQWFFTIGKPTSSACVEVGMKSHEGHFVRIARSGRVSFPAREPVGAWADPEWLTVRTATGEVGQPVSAGGAQGAAGGLSSAAGGQSNGVALTGGQGGRAAPGFWREILGAGARRFHGEEWREVFHSDFTDGIRTLEWQGPTVRSAWEAGPFTYAVEPPQLVEERYEGNVTVYTHEGRTHVVSGPWQVVVRGINARAERRVVATWEIYRSWVASEGYEVVTGAGWRLMPGASEMIAVGASERRWLGASELRLGGSSALYAMGASELRFMGASERFLGGASEWMARGSSEWMQGGASELRFQGSSELTFQGASERRLQGASEGRLGGASENVPGGGSSYPVR
jgi:hypothetical protein